MAERRAVYRQTKGLEEIKVAVAWAGREYVDAELVDLSARGAAVSLRGMEGEAVPDVGSAVTLRFAVPSGQPVTDIVAYVRNERESGRARVFGLEIADWRKLRDQLPAKWFTAFNRRRHYRVDVPRQPPIEVEVNLAAGGVITGTMKNVSAGGCLLLLDQSAAGTTPRTGERVQVVFQLPDSDFRYDLIAHVRSTFPVDDATGYGLEFDAGGSRNFIAQQGTIANYVMQRQRELLASRTKTRTRSAVG